MLRISFSICTYLERFECISYRWPVLHCIFVRGLLPSRFRNSPAEILIGLSELYNFNTGCWIRSFFKTVQNSSCAASQHNSFFCSKSLQRGAGMVDEEWLPSPRTGHLSWTMDMAMFFKLIYHRFKFYLLTFCKAKSVIYVESFLSYKMQENQWPELIKFLISIYSCQIKFRSLSIFFPVVWWWLQQHIHAEQGWH